MYVAMRNSAGVTLSTQALTPMEIVCNFFAMYV